MVYNSYDVKNDGGKKNLKGIVQSSIFLNKQITYSKRYSLIEYLKLQF